jgi:hypothetical protein
MNKYTGDIQMNECESCAYNAYDDEWECYVCEMNLDEDEYSKFIQNKHEHCPYYRDGNEYKIAGKQ